MLDSILLNLKKSVFEMILCIIMSLGIIINVIQAFYIPESIDSNMFLLAGIIALITAVLFISASNKTTIIFSICASIIFSLGALFGIVSGRLLVSKESFTVAVIIFTVVTSVFLLTRFLYGTLILFLFGIGVTIVVVLFGYENRLVGFSLFLFGSAGAFFFRNYTRNAKQHNDNPNLKSIFIFSIIVSLICAISLASSASLYMYVIKPLNPPSNQMALITKLKSMNILKKAGVSSEIHMYNDNLTAKSNDTERKIQNNVNPKPNNASMDNKKNNDVPNKQQPQTNSNLGDGPKDSQTKTEAISYFNKNYTYIIIPSLIVGFVILCIYLKILMRRMWFKRLVSSNSRQTQVIQLYLNYIKKLSAVGLKKKDSDTFYEYANKVNNKFKPVSKINTNFMLVTDLFIKTKYGNSIISDSDYIRFIDFYKTFFKTAREYLGLRKYSLKFFIL